MQTALFAVSVVISFGVISVVAGLLARKNKKKAQQEAESDKFWIAAMAPYLALVIDRLENAIMALAEEVDESEIAHLRRDLNNLQELKKQFEIDGIFEPFNNVRQEIDFSIDNFKKVIANIKKEMECLVASVEETETVINNAGRQGFATEKFSARFISVCQEVEQVRSLLEVKMFAAATRLIWRVKDKLYQIRTEVGDLERRQQRDIASWENNGGHDVDIGGESG